MIRRRLNLRSDQRGAAAIEMAIALPVLVTGILGIFSIGQLFEGNAGMQHALGEGARYGTLCLAQGTNGCTLPTGTAIKGKVTAKLFGTSNGTFDTPTLDTSTASSGYVTLSVTYHYTMKFAFVTGPTVDLTRSKRIYLADIPGTSSDCSNGTSTSPACVIYS